MEAPRLADVPAFRVAGLTTRTTNEREMSGDTGQIGPLWGAFFAGGADRIAGVADRESIYAVYTGYESDHHGAYDVILGRLVNETADCGPENAERPHGGRPLSDISGSGIRSRGNPRGMGPGL